MKKFLLFLKENRRSLLYMGAALALEGAGLMAAMSLLASPRPQELLASLILVALPGAVLTVFVPGLRDSSRRLRTWAFAFLTVGVAVGLVGISAMFYAGPELGATIAVGLGGILVTAVVSYVDWSPVLSIADSLGAVARDPTPGAATRIAERVTSSRARTGHPIKWFLLCLVAIGVYCYLVRPRRQK